MKKLFSTFFFFALSLSALAQCYVLEHDSEIKLTTTIASFGGVQSQALALEGYPYQLTFEGKQAALSVNQCYVQYSTDGATSWVDLVKPDCGTSYKSFGPYELPQNATHIRFNAKTGSTNNRTFRNIKVTCRPLELITTYGEYSASICDGDSVEYNGVWYKESFSGDITLTNQYGADSIVALTVNALPTYLIQDEAIRMYVGAERTWRERDLSTYPAGIYNLFDSLKTEAGCDSVYCVALTIAETPATYGEYAASVCQGDSVEYDGVWYYGAFADSVTLSVPNQFGGDSIVALTVTELLPTRYEYTDTIKVGDPYNDGIFDVIVYDAGTYELTDTLFNGNEVSCDSIIALTLVVEENGNPGPTTSVGGVEQSVPCTKYFIDGQLYIRRGDEEYLIDGRRK